jgi:hypothetical protein
MLAGLSLLGCGSRDDPSTGALDSAGVQISTGPAADRPLPWFVLTTQRLGADDPDNPLQLVRWPGWVTADTAGRIYVLNEVLDRIEVRDSSGRYLKARGRKGGGPGEYQYPSHLHASADGFLSVVDQGKSAVIRFDPQGTVLPERSFAALGYAFGGIIFLGDTAVLHGRDADAANRPVHALRWITPTADTTLLTLRPRSLGTARFQCPGFTVTLNGVEVLLAPELQWAVGQGRLAATTQERYEVMVFSGPRLSQLLRRPLLAVPATAEYVRRRYPEGQIVGRAPCRKQAEELIAKFGLTENLPVLGRLRYAPDGSLWVQRFTLPGTTSLTDVYSPAGQYLGTLAGPGFPVAFLSGGRFLGLLPDQESGAYQALVYRLASAPW